MKKRLLATMLCFCLVMTMLPAVAQAASDFPAVTTDTVAKTAAIQKSVDFTLSNAYSASDIWKVYDGVNHVYASSTVTASVYGATTLRLSGNSNDIPAATYYVTVTEAGKSESNRLALTVGEYVPPKQSATSVAVGGVTLDGMSAYATTNSSGGVTTAGATEGNYNVKFENGTLTLRNATITGTVHAIEATGDLTVVLEGASTVTGTGRSDNSSGVYVDGSITISGSGSLEVTGGSASRSSHGVCSYGDVNISDNAAVKVTGGEVSGSRWGSSYGMLSFGKVNISGAADVTATGGTVTATGTVTAIGTVTGASSYGLMGHGITISGSKVEASGGDVIASGGPVLNAISGSIYSDRDVKISGAADVTATGGTVQASGGISIYASSFGIGSGGSYDGRLYDNIVGVSISGSTVKATGGVTTATTTTTATGGGVRAYSCGVRSDGVLHIVGVSISDSMVEATGGELTVTAATSVIDSNSCGVYSSGDVNISGGTVTTSGGAAANSYAVYSNAIIPATPIVSMTTVAKTAPIQKSVDFTLTNSSAYGNSHTWKVYNNVVVDYVYSSVTADISGSTLTLTHDTDIPAATYYVTVTEAGKTVGALRILTVGPFVPSEQSATPAVNPTTVAKTKPAQASVNFNLTNSSVYDSNQTWKVYNSNNVADSTVTAHVYGSVLTLSHAADIPAATYYVSVTEAHTLESDRLGLTVNPYVPPEQSDPPAVTTDTVAKTAATQKSVEFPLSKACTANDIWKVYDGANVTTHVYESNTVTAHVYDPSYTTLTLSARSTDIATGSYYVSVTEAGKTESERKALTVNPYVPQPVTYAVTVNGSYAAASGVGDYEQGDTVTINAGSRSNYSFIGWSVNSGNVTLANASNATTTFTMPPGNITVTANWTSSGSGSGSSGSNSGGDSSGNTPVTPTPTSEEAAETGAPVVTAPVTDSATSTVTTEVTSVLSGSTASAVVSAAAANQAVDSALQAARENNVTPVVAISVDTSALADSIEITLPVMALETLSSHEEAVLSVSSEVGEVILDAQALSAISGQAEGTITISLAPVDVARLNETQQETVGDAKIYDISVSSGNKTISVLDGGKAQVSVPYELAEGQSQDGVTVYYLDDEGDLHECETGYDPITRIATFITEHLSLYIIAYEEVDSASVKFVNPFTDVAESDWFYSAVKYVFEKELMKGTGESVFSPYNSTTRGMVVTILHNLEESPAVSGNPFDDVDTDQYYAGPIAWAALNNIVTGYGDAKFGPNDSITREQMAVILMNYAGYKGYDISVGEDTNILSYTDAESISEYAISALQWACGAGLMQGDGSKLMPAGKALRCQTASILMRFCETFSK